MDKISLLRFFGFSLIELMVVILIIGSLASIAMPGYKNYILKAKVIEAISLVSPIKLEITEKYFLNNSLPKSLSKDCLQSIEQIIKNSKNFNNFKYIARNGAFGLAIKLKNPTSSTQSTVYFWAKPRGGFLSWECSANGMSDSIPSDLYPKSCAS